jgi:hypothetical protein
LPYTNPTAAGRKTWRPENPAAPAAAGAFLRALPRDEALDRILSDPALGSTSKAIVVALAHHWAWKRPYCWPSDRTIAAKVGRSPGHVQRCLRELERSGFIRREATPEVPNGRRIWLRWREPAPSAGAQTPCAPALRPPAAPARTEAVVSLKPLNEALGQALGSTTTTSPEGPAQGPGRIAQAAPGATPVPEVARPPAPAVPTPPRGAQPAAVPATRPRRFAMLGREALAELAARTGDPILLGELLKVSGPRPAPEPDPWSLPLADLIPRLPGRHDLVMPAARKLCLAVDDTAAATLRAAAKMAEAVARREVTAASLSDCLRQATGPQARHRGKVLVASWKRCSAAGRAKGSPLAR